MKEYRAKIPCTVGILTLNSAQGLQACLDSVSDFAEIIVCDGNSTDGTQRLALSRGVKLMKQYESEESNIPCVKDKANVRQKNMLAASHDWYFFMDADDTLSPEVVQEIREIVSNKNPTHLIYRMPTRIFFELEDGGLKEIKHEATYPSYQTRLVHRLVGAHFKGPVHDRLSWDLKQFPVGTMRGYYNFHWPNKRVKHFWGYMGRYADWELQISPLSNFRHLMYWGIYRRLRTICGYLFYRLPKMYARYGFNDSMPLVIEMQIVLYHSKILFGGIIGFLRTRRFWIYLQELIRGQKQARISVNLKLLQRQKDYIGKILDVGGSKDSSYYRFLRLHKWHHLTIGEPSIIQSAMPHQSFDYVFLLNLSSLTADLQQIFAKTNSILRDRRSDSWPGVSDRQYAGELLGFIPVEESRSREQTQALNKSSLNHMLVSAGFRDVEVQPICGITNNAKGYLFWASKKTHE